MGELFCFTVNPLLSSLEGLFILNTFEGGRGGGLFDLAITMVSVLHKELEYKVENLSNKKLEVMLLRIKNNPNF